MTISDLKNKIIKANKAYRTGNPIISDAEYDILLADAEEEMNPIEFLSFKKSLMDDDGKATIKLDYIIGSLNKIKYEDRDDLIKWIKSFKVRSVFVSEKIDGCSAVVSIRNGEMVLCTSRGDGDTGTDWTEKAKHIIKNHQMPSTNMDIRGEFTLTNNLFEYKNRRNGTVGIMNNDNPPKEKLNAITFIAYEILDSKDTIVEQFETLQACGYRTPFHGVLVVDSNINETLKDTYLQWKKNADYDIDGIVLSPTTYKNENVYYPEQKIAFKVNSEGINVQVTGIDWAISKGGLLKPVVEIVPTDIEGSTISRVTGIHAQWIKENGIGEGAVVSVIKSGCVIPKIIKVINTTKVNLPTVCPSCGGLLQMKSVDLVCNNIHCGDKLVKELSSFLVKCGVENVSDKSLTNWGIVSYDDLLAFDPDTNSKSQDKFANELTTKVFSKTKEDLFSCMSFDGAGSTNINKLIEHFGGSIETATSTLFIKKNITDFPEGIGQKVVDKVEADWMKNLNVLKSIITDKRWNPKAKVVTVSTGKLSGKTFLLTGSFTEGKAALEKLIKANGGELVSSVSKKLNYLVCAPDSWGASSKFVKAEKLENDGVKIITEDNLKGMI